jgi:putative uncharacterized protein 53|nr:MAG TPA: Protein of unknown function (DUF1366) [Caudoviricetes sp.]
MAINNYELASKPYTRGFGDNIRTVVEIRLEDGTRYSTNMRELAGDRTSESDDVLIQAVLDILKAELDPGSAIVKAQQDLVMAKNKQDELSKIVKQQQETNILTQRMIKVIVLNSVMSENIMYGTIYKDLVSLLPALKRGETYFEEDLVTIENPDHVEQNGEGKHVIVQVNREFEYTGQTFREFEGEMSRNGIVAVWKWVPPKSNVDHI